MIIILDNFKNYDEIEMLLNVYSQEYTTIPIYLDTKAHLKRQSYIIHQNVEPIKFDLYEKYICNSYDREQRTTDSSIGDYIIKLKDNKIYKALLENEKALNEILKTNTSLNILMNRTNFDQIFRTGLCFLDEVDQDLQDLLYKVDERKIITIASNEATLNKNNLVIKDFTSYDKVKESLKILEKPKIEIDLTTQEGLDKLYELTKIEFEI